MNEIIIDDKNVESQKKDRYKEERQEIAQDENKFIGLIMPISDSTDYIEGHWQQVRNVIEDCVNQYRIDSKTKIDCQIVSESKSSERIIQKNIVNNLYKADLVICDVSSKNPNVMFELGMRLAFDKKVIIIKDEITAYNFDTNPIAHINYKKDLNYVAIKSFQKELLEAIKSSMKDGNARGGYLDSFADIEVQNISTKSVDEGHALNMILSEIKSMKNDIYSLKSDYEYTLLQKNLNENHRNIKISNKSKKELHPFVFSDEGKLLMDREYASKYVDEMLDKLNLPHFFVDEETIEEYLMKNNPEFLDPQNLDLLVSEVRKKNF